MYVADTVTTGGATCGNWAIGSVGIETRPARMMKSAHTDANTGRCRKKLITNRRAPSPGYLGDGEVKTFFAKGELAAEVGPPSAGSRCACPRRSRAGTARRASRQAAASDYPEASPRSCAA